MNINEKRYPIPQAAKILGLAPKTLWGWRSAGKISVYEIGRRVFIGEAELLRILEESWRPARRVA